MSQQNEKVSVYHSLSEALQSLFGNNVHLTRQDRVSGGDINEAYRLELTDGSVVFMKANRRENADSFAAEAAGLAAIARTQTIATPRLLGRGLDDRGGFSFLLLEFISGTNRITDYWEVFAGQLAAMHQAETAEFVEGGVYGFTQDNYIGATPQRNTAYGAWIPFFRDCRLEPQFKNAESYFRAAEYKKIIRLLDRLEDLLTEPVQPSLLHGDLWSGNAITGSDGKAWLIDPAVYVGHAEADVAMTELFGGFPPRFYDAYREVGGLQEGYGQRRDLYNLYHLLNHLNLFGTAYLSSVRRTIEKYL